jgi:hypothetical protein
MPRYLPSQLSHWIGTHLLHADHPGKEIPHDTRPHEGEHLIVPSPRALTIETITLRITEDEIYWAVQTGLKRPILVALQRATGTLWRLFEDGTAIEVMAPHRACVLPQEALYEVNETAGVHELIGTTWEVPLFPTSQQDGYSLT